jgi:DNA-binding NarL/FixJ family response regulator
MKPNRWPNLHDDEFNLSPQITGAIIKRIAELKQLTKELAGLDGTHSPTPKPELTAREWEVLGMIEQGLTNHAIAEALVIELGTVKNHVHNILTKLDVCSREHAALFASQMLSPSD